MRKETVDVDIPITSRIVDRKIIKPLRITSGAPTRIRVQNQFSQLRLTSTKVIPIKRTKAGYVLMMSQGFTTGTT